MYYGCKPSKLDGTEIIVDEVLDTMDIPNEYNYIAYLPDAYNQGSRPTCVPHAISAFVDWYNVSMVLIKICLLIGYMTAERIRKLME